MSITKIVKSVMEVTADYQKLSDLNVAFYNQDINTSILQFNVTRNDAPVPLGKSNVEGYIVLLHEDGSRVQDNLVIENEEHGVIQYTIPREFLKHTGKAAGQVYIAVKGRDDTAVMRQFSFDIKQDLLTGFSSSVKLEYIKTFDDLKEQIKHRVDAIEEAIANGEDYVAQMVETLDTGKKEIAATVSKANTDINKVATDAKNIVTATADTATKDITSKATKATTDIDKTVSDGQKNITDTSNTAVATVNAKAKEVVDAIENNEVALKKDTFTNVDGKGYSRPVPEGTTDWYQITVAGNYSITKTSVPTNAPPVGVYFNLIVNTRTSTTRDLTAVNVTTGAIYTNAMTSGGWSGWNRVAFEKEVQISKITADNGSPKYDLSATKDLFSEASTWGNGIHTFYLSAGATNNPAGTSSYITGIAQFYGNSGGITAFDRFGKQFYAARTGAATFSAWQDYTPTDTGWITYNTLNGILANTAFAAVGDNGYKCAYRKITTNGVTRLLLRVNISNITTETVAFAALPKNIVDNSQTGVARTNGANQKPVITLRPSGYLSINVPTGMTANAYVYQQFEWTL